MNSMGNYRGLKRIKFKPMQAAGRPLQRATFLTTLGLTEKKFGGKVYGACLLLFAPSMSRSMTERSRVVEIIYERSLLGSIKLRAAMYGEDHRYVLTTAYITACLHTSTAGQVQS